MSQRVAISLLALGLLFLTGCGLTASRHNEGYAQLQPLSGSDVDERVSLSLGPAVLRLAASTSAEDQQERELLQGLKGVRIKVYDIRGDAHRVAYDLQEMSENLQQSGWDLVVKVREGAESTDILVKLNGEEVTGLTLLNVDTLEVVIVNVMGNMQPDRLAGVMAALDVAEPEGAAAATAL